jgi:3-oxoacyl-[acyl-carrier-protein] synthase II
VQPGRIVITGAGAVTPIGVELAAFARGLRAGASGVRPLAIDGPHRSTVCADCLDWNPDSVMRPAEAAKLPRLVPMALAAAAEAMRRSCLAAYLEAETSPGREGSAGRAQNVGLILGTGAGGIDFTLDQFGGRQAGRRLSLWTITNATHGNLAGELSIRLGLRGPSLCVSDGCASASDACGVAMELLRSQRPGAPDAMVVVGADAHLRSEVFEAMELLGVITPAPCAGDAALAAGASRPFDRRRDGFVLGEGAWAIVLERGRHAAERGAPVIGELAGYGATCDAYHRVRPDPDMTECARAMQLCAADAGARMSDFELIHYHGTATQLNDALETRVVKAAFGEHARRLRGTSVKSMIGHPQGAGGLASLVASLIGMNPACAGDEGPPFIPPTINLDEPDPECDLDYTPRRAVELAPGPRLVMVNCLAFGAKNSALALLAG